MAIAVGFSGGVLAWQVLRQGLLDLVPQARAAFMQAMGLVNDHVEGCCARPRAEAARAAFVRPARVASS